MWKIVLPFCIIFVKTSMSTPCVIRSYETENFFPLPLFENENGLINITGILSNIVIEDGNSMFISCIGSYLKYYRISYENIESATLTCRNGTFVSDWLPGENVLMNWVSCDRPPQLIEKHTENSCGEQNKGKITEIYIKSKLHEDHYIYEACFDDSIKQPLYVKYTVERNRLDHFASRSQKYLTGDNKLFSGVRIQQFFENRYQMDLFRNLLGSIYWEYFKFGDELMNGTLITETYFQFDPEQRSVYNYIDCVPIWNKIYDGSWMSSSSSVFILASESDIINYSGAWGVQTLKDTNGIQQEIRLEDPELKRYPSPQWLYRVSYDEKSKKGIALLILNNPFVTVDEAEEYAKIFPCSDVCPNWSWITEATPKKGYVICCDINDFRKVVKDLPEFETVGLLP